jgi:hypothetical protein
LKESGTFFAELGIGGIVSLAARAFDSHSLPLGLLLRRLTRITTGVNQRARIPRKKQVYEQPFGLACVYIFVKHKYMIREEH